MVYKIDRTNQTSNILRRYSQLFSNVADKNKGANMLKTIGRENLKLENVPHNKEWAIAEKKNQLTECINCIEEKMTKITPNLILTRNGKKAVVLKWANFDIEGFELGVRPTTKLKLDTLKEIRDSWLEEPENQELVWGVHQEMTTHLQNCRKKEVA